MDLDKQLRGQGRGGTASCAVYLFHLTAILMMLISPLPARGAEGARAALHPPRDMAAPVETDKRLQRNIRALVVPRQHATISSRLRATINAIGPDSGERFKKGDRLVVFDCAIFKAELRRAEAQFEAARDTRKVKAELSRAGTISKLQLVLARAELRKAEAEHILASERVANCAVLAPFDGRVVRRIANAFETVSFGDPLIEIVNDASVELQLYVPSKWISHLKTGKPFGFHVDETGLRLRAEIIAIGAWIDNVSQLIEIRAICPDAADQLLPGMSGRAEFEHIK